MNEKEELSIQYNPIQPTAMQETEDIVYREITPDDNLKQLIYCYWQLKTTEPLPYPYNYRVVADGCTDIFFDLGNPADCSVMGFCRKFTTFPIGTDFNYVGIRFYPSVFSQLFKVNSKYLSNIVSPLSEVLPDFAHLIETIFKPHDNIDDIGSVFNIFLGQWIKDLNFELDYRFYDAIDIILSKKGQLDIETELNTGLSSRQLRRIFNYYIGTTPKSFSKVIRFQYILNATLTNEKEKTRQAYYDVGYYDQAHFIKEFKNYYGVTPSEAFR